MPPVTVAFDDLAPFAEIDSVKAEAMIDDALALAARVAPCILDAEFEYADAAKAILRGAILRWNDAGSGAVVSQQAGPFGQTVDTKSTRRGMFWPSEITDLQELCKDPSVSKAKAYMIDQVQPTGVDTLAGRPDLWFQWVQPVPPDAS